MEAIQFDPNTTKLSLIRKKIPEVNKPDHVLVKVAYSGFCGTDLHIIKREFPCCDQPFTQGHEFSGIVHQVGSQVTHVRVGDRVAVDPQNWCSTCYYCTTGRYHHCELGGVEMATGIRYDGGWAEYALVLGRQVYKLPDNVSLKQGAFCEPVSCIIRGIERASLKPPGFQSILVVGAGIIGNLWCAILHHMGHRDVTVVEPQKVRIDLNKKLETGFKCLTPEEFRYAVEMDGQTWDLAVDCSGCGRAVEDAITALRTGGTICLFGVAPPSTRIRISPFDMFKKELTICGTYINPFSFPQALKLVAAMGDRYIDYNKLGVSEFQMKDYAKSVPTLESASTAKVMFVINSQLE